MNKIHKIEVKSQYHGISREINIDPFDTVHVILNDQVGSHGFGERVELNTLLTSNQDEITKLKAQVDSLRDQLSESESMVEEYKDLWQNEQALRAEHHG